MNEQQRRAFAADVFIVRSALGEASKFLPAGETPSARDVQDVIASAWAIDMPIERIVECAMGADLPIRERDEMLSEDPTRKLPPVR